MFVLLRTKRMQLRNHADTQTVKRSKQWSVTRAMRYIYIYLQYQIWNKCARQISLRKLCGGTAHFRTLEGALLMNEEMSSFFCQVVWLSHVQRWCCSCTRNLLHHPN